MNPFPLVVSSWRQYPGTALLTVLLVALAVALGTAASLLEPSIRNGVTSAAGRFDLLVGAPGGETQLVLSSVYLEGTPLPLLSGDVLEQVRQEPGIAWCSPLVMGDNWQRRPIIGVDSVFLQGQGEFADNTDAYVGALVPLEPGQTFHGTHGAVAASPSGEFGHEHATAYVVRGRLAPTGTPWDRALLVSADSVWQAHGLHNDEDGHEHDEHAASALVIKPASVADAYRLRALYRTEISVALFPAEVLVRLYAVLGDVQVVLIGMTRLAQAAVLLSVLMAVFVGMARRQKMLGVLRALGAPRVYGAAALWLEVVMMLAVGGVLGLGLGLAAMRATAGFVAGATGLHVPVILGMDQWLSFGMTLLAGSFAALLPAWNGYRLPVVRALRA